MEGDQEYKRKFRGAAAGLIKSLIRARITQEPMFLSADDRSRWGVEDTISEKRPCAELLTRVELLRKKFWENYLSEQDSIPVVAPEVLTEEERFDQLVDQVAFFISSSLENAIDIAKQQKKVPWNELAHWDQLPEIRDALDKLPEAQKGGGTPGIDTEKKPMAQSKNVILYGLRDCPIVLGKKKKPLGPKQYELIQCLIAAGDEGCSKSQLERITTGYWRMLNTLRKDPDWTRVLHFPGKPHGGYWIS